MTDSCPQCLTPGNPPRLVIPVAEGTEETYRCGRCGHQWWTAWAAHDDYRDDVA